MRRRHFLSLTSASLGGILTHSLTAQDTGSIRIPLRFFTAEEGLSTAAAVARIFPSDASGPGATEAGVAIYIDRQLAGPYGRDRYRYTQGPFAEGTPEQGYQAKATPREIYRKGLKTLKGLAALPPSAQDDKLRTIETTMFFHLLRQHTLEGMFCDPMHGGNRNLIGWQLIGFPGPYMSWAGEIDRHFGEAFRPKPQSLSQILNRTIQPWEDLEP